MIAPDKHTEIGTSVPYLSGLVLKEITDSGVIKYDELKNSVFSKIGSNVGETFEYALSFLFLLNRISYNKFSDSFLVTQ